MDALHRTVVDGFLDLLLGSSGGVIDFREVFIVKTEDLRADFSAKSAGDTFILVNHRDLAHKDSPSFKRSPFRMNRL
jgi:hypothetical protein